MLTAVVTTSHSGGPLQVNLLEAETCERTDLNGEEFPVGSEECPELNPIAPEAKEMIWGFGAFMVLLVVLYFWLFPKVRKGMQARYDSIQSDKESADTLTAAARADVAEYEARLTSVRAEAQQKVDAARATLESERSEQIAAANARIAEKRAAATAEVDAARQAAMADVESAVTDVVSRATEIATGKAPNPATVQAAVSSAMGTTTGASS
ncbi:F0F1 ATP synthase subunit B family protein [Ilumatobacter nonamiensis]|uniref:F0F1 ATP synthase subunit B family protein n=1 Tax=Ilumatobacter nonamiensis TaxID=467093 RepID=UPI00034CC3D7|nr:ATP synthase F0 subunit B [Ilumatobacter nonamiensis]